jgi:hypothetical protein
VVPLFAAHELDHLKLFDQAEALLKLLPPQQPDIGLLYLMEYLSGLENDFEHSNRFGHVAKVQL